MTESQAATLRHKIRRLVNAAVADSWKGGGDPADIPVIEEALKKRRTDLQEFINFLTEPTT